MTLCNMTVWLSLKSVGPVIDEDIMSKCVIIAMILLLATSGVLSACGRAEYLIGQECCPMCGAGSYVRRHCDEFASTTCVPCLPSTFTDAPNGLRSCMPCKVCDSGLRVKRVCSSTSDALCETLEGFYCVDPIKDGCHGAEEHTKCSPGQYIKQPGTSASDSVCDDCTGDTFSNGSFTSCRPHTQCEVTGLIVVRKGTAASDTECGDERNRATHVGVIVSGIAVVLCAVLFGISIVHRKWKKHQPTMQTATLGDVEVATQNDSVWFNQDTRNPLICFHTIYQVPNKPELPI